MRSTNEAYFVGSVPDIQVLPYNSGAVFTEYDDYEKFMGRWSRRLAPQITRFAGVAEGQRVLDVGTGTGALATEVVANLAPAAVVAVDPSADFIAHARAHNTDPRLRFEVGDGQGMRFDDDSFDCSVSLLAINFVAEPPRAAREMQRVTRPGGTAVAAVWDYAEGMTMLRWFWSEVAAIAPRTADRDEKHMAYCRREQLAGLWTDAGFTGVTTTALEIEQKFSSFDDFWTPFLLGTGPSGAVVERLEPEERKALRGRLWQRVLGSRADGAFAMTARAWCVRGRVG